MSASRIATSDTSGRSRPFAQQVDADQHVEHAAPQVAQNLDPLQRVDVRVQVADLDAELLVVRRQVLGHPLGQRRHQHALAPLGAVANLLQQIVDLPLDRPDLDGRIHQPGGPNHLLDDHAAGLVQLVRAGRGRDVHRVAAPALPTLRSSAGGCRAPTAAGIRSRRALPCATDRRDTCRGPEARSGGSRRR